MLRVVGAGTLMGSAVWLASQAGFLTTLDDKIVLLLLVGIGIVVYGAASLLLKAISPGEARYVYGLTVRGLGRLVRRK